MKKIILSFAVLCAAVAGKADLYVSGSANLVGGAGWQANECKMVDNQYYTFQNLGEGTYDLKVTNGTWDWSRGFREANLAASSRGVFELNGNIAFTIPSGVTKDVTVKYVYDRVCVVFSDPIPTYQNGGIAFFLPNGVTFDAQTGAITTTNDSTGYRNEWVDAVPQDAEANAARWFRDEYVYNGKGIFMSAADFHIKANRDKVSAMWIHIDREEGQDKGRHEYQDEQGLDWNFRGNDQNSTKDLLHFVTDEGKNLLLSKQACHLLGNMNRIRKADSTTVWPEYPIGGYTKTNEQWFIATNFGNYDNEETNQHFHHNMTGHRIYSDHMGDPITGIPGNLESAWVKDGGYNKCTDHNCGISTGEIGMTFNSDYQALENFETLNACRVLGTWGKCADMPYAGMMEFYPKKWDDTYNFKGTILMYGLATYLWNTNNRGWGHENIAKITRSALTYLSETNPFDYVWTTEPKDGKLGDHSIVVEHKDHSFIDWQYDNTKLFLKNDGTYPFENTTFEYLAEGQTTIKAVRTGDGIWHRKNLTYTIEKTIGIYGDTYSRQVKNYFSTVCLPYEATLTDETAKIYTLTGKEVMQGEVTRIVLDEVEGQTLEAGKPYLIRTQATADSPVTITFSLANDLTEEAQTDNGLVGTFRDIEVTAATCALPYYLSATDNMLHLIENATVRIGANKAYFNLEETSLMDDVQTAPGRLIMNVQGKRPVATDVENVIDATKAVKFIQNGKVYIRRGNNVYDVLGK